MWSLRNKFQLSADMLNKNYGSILVSGLELDCTIHFENYEGPSSLLRQNSLLLAELKKKNSFSRKSSSNLQLAPPFNLFSRNPSMDGSSFLIPQCLPSESSYRLDYPEGLDSFSI